MLCIVLIAGGQAEKEVMITRVTLHQIRSSRCPSCRSSRRLSYVAREISFPQPYRAHLGCKAPCWDLGFTEYPRGSAVTPWCLRTPQNISSDSKLLEIPMQLQVILNVTGFRPILRGALKREGVGGRGQDTAEFGLFQIS